MRIDGIKSTIWFSRIQILPTKFASLSPALVLLSAASSNFSHVPNLRYHACREPKYTWYENALICVNPVCRGKNMLVILFRAIWGVFAIPHLWIHKLSHGLWRTLQGRCYSGVQKV